MRMCTCTESIMPVIMLPIPGIPVIPLALSGRVGAAVAVSRVVSFLSAHAASTVAPTSASAIMRRLVLVIACPLEKVN